MILQSLCHAISVNVMSEQSLLSLRQQDTAFLL